ncbi:peptide-methionine (S)-S-oxide reductase MsrA [Meridianimarinicoccus sp. RP-17]|uniref:peptide-methionine (S)-S-oxide reductase MsrA n=1 Tax=Meridianimarinicoccus zhengii TaxID=2056810 RepID=UPI000DAD7BE2|nr:peptide-methionine (S)-S-oxide reductase MsrA [Phycocomes zhengii]
MRRIETLKILMLALAIVAGLGMRGAQAQEQEGSALVAGGCFWCVEADFEKIPGITEAVSGFAGGTVENPTYREVTRGGTGHLEAVMIRYDPSVIGYREVLDIFLRSIDPLDDGGQFCDRGHSYSPAIFALDDAQARIAEAALAGAAADLGRGSLKVPLREAAPFYPADAYHQDYYKSDDLIISRFGPISKANAYVRYRDACGRDRRIRAVWGDAALPGEALVN